MPDPRKSGFLLIGLTQSAPTVKSGLSSPLVTGETILRALDGLYGRQLLPEEVTRVTLPTVGLGYPAGKDPQCRSPSSHRSGGTMTDLPKEARGDWARGHRVAVVTGGARGIGEAVVRRLSETMGLTTMIADRDEAAADALACDLAENGARVHAMQLDVSSAESVDDFYAKLSEGFGRCDVLVNNAGIASFASFAEVSLDDWNAHLSVNLTGALLMAQRAVPLMEQAHWGRIVNVTSISGIRASVGRAAYGTSKGALCALTRQMAVELVSSGITVNAVAPGPVDTAMAQRLHSDGMRESYNSLVPMGRYATPSEVAAPIAFLCSDDASYITGQILSVDGGYMAAGLLRY